MQKKKVEEKEKEGKQNRKKLVAEPLNRCMCAKQWCGEGTVSCIWKLGTSIENRGSMAIQVEQNGGSHDLVSFHVFVA